MMVVRFIEMCRRRALKVNAGESRVMVMNVEEEFDCELQIDGIRLEYVSEFKYFGCAFDESDTDGAECSSKGVSGRRVSGPIRPLVTARDLQLECASLA